MRHVRRHTPYIALAALLLIGLSAMATASPTQAIGADWADLGLLDFVPPGRAQLPLCRMTWLSMLEAAFDISSCPDKAKAQPHPLRPDRLSSLRCCTIRAAEAAACLYDLAAMPAYTALPAVTDGPTALSRRISLNVGGAAIHAALAALPIATPPAVEPAAVVRGYYQALGSAIASPERGAEQMSAYCCGSALRRLQRNLPALSGGHAFRLVSLQIKEVAISGHLAKVTVRRTADIGLGSLVHRTTNDDVLYLRCTRRGWRIYR